MEQELNYTSYLAIYGAVISTISLSGVIVSYLAYRNNQPKLKIKLEYDFTTSDNNINSKVYLKIFNLSDKDIILENLEIFIKPRNKLKNLFRFFYYKIQQYNIDYDLGKKIVKSRDNIKIPIEKPTEIEFYEINKFYIYDSMQKKYKFSFLFSNIRENTKINYIKSNENDNCRINLIQTGKEFIFKIVEFKRVRGNEVITLTKISTSPILSYLKDEFYKFEKERFN